MTKKILLGITILFLNLWSGMAIWAAAAEDVEEDGFRRVVSYHLGRYPSMEIQDLYKLVFQAAMGSEHAVPNRQMAQQWLDRELSTLAAVSEEPFSEPLSPEGGLVRVHLRAFVERGGDTAKLLDAFVATADRFHGSEERLEEYWSYLEAMAEAGEVPFSQTQLRGLFAEMRIQGFPAVHHSNTYRDHYQPAYRVVLLELLSPESPLITAQ